MYRLMVVLTIVVIGVFFSVWQNVQIVKTGKKLTEKEKVLEELKLRNRMLEIKIGNLKSLSRIENISKNELGLTKIGDFRVVYLKDDSVGTRLASLSSSKKNNVISKLFGRCN
jgi:cell division protein FtsB